MTKWDRCKVHGWKYLRELNILMTAKNSGERLPTPSDLQNALPSSFFIHSFTLRHIKCSTCIQLIKLTTDKDISFHDEICLFIDCRMKISSIRCGESRWRGWCTAFIDDLFVNRVLRVIDFRMLAAVGEQENIEEKHLERLKESRKTRSNWEWWGEMSFEVRGSFGDFSRKFWEILRI
jgi:hypothetical protein